MSVLSSPHFHYEAEAFEFLESIVWAGGVVCPHCGVTGGRVYDLSGVRTKASKKSPQGKVRYGLKKCGECRAQFTAKFGTVFEHARLPLTKMLQAVHPMVSSKKYQRPPALPRSRGPAQERMVPGPSYPRSHALG